MSRFGHGQYAFAFFLREGVDDGVDGHRVVFPADVAEQLHELASLHLAGLDKLLLLLFELDVRFGIVVAQALPLSLSGFAIPARDLPIVERLCLPGDALVQLLLGQRDARS